MDASRGWVETRGSGGGDGANQPRQEPSTTGRPKSPADQDRHSARWISDFRLDTQESTDRVHAGGAAEIGYLLCGH